MKFAKTQTLRCGLRPGNITVLGRKGEVVQRIPTEGACPTNLVFAGRAEENLCHRSGDKHGAGI